MKGFQFGFKMLWKVRICHKIFWMVIYFFMKNEDIFDQNFLKVLNFRFHIDFYQVGFIPGIWFFFGSRDFYPKIGDYSDPWFSTRELEIFVKSCDSYTGDRRNSWNFGFRTRDSGFLKISAYLSPRILPKLRDQHEIFELEKLCLDFYPGNFLDFYPPYGDFSIPGIWRFSRFPIGGYFEFYKSRSRSPGF